MKTSSKQSKTIFSNQTERLLSSLVSNRDTAQKKINNILSQFQQPVMAGGDASSTVENLILRFHSVATELRSRYDSRPTLLIDDEYDTQDLLEGLLRINFDDVRREQWTPEYAGCSTRIDFILQNEKIAIEVKKTRKGLGKKEVGNQLIIDIAHYKKHPNCKTLYCFVYDPEEIISNPVGLETDLNGVHDDGLFVKVMITPKR